MHTLSKLPLVLLLSLLTPPAWRGNESVSGSVPQRWAGLFSDQGPQADSKQATPPLYQTTLTTTFFAPTVVGLASHARSPVFDHMAKWILRH